MGDGEHGRRVADGSGRAGLLMSAHPARRPHAPGDAAPRAACPVGARSRRSERPGHRALAGERLHAERRIKPGAGPGLRCTGVGSGVGSAAPFQAFALAVLLRGQPCVSGREQHVPFPIGPLGMGSSHAGSTRRRKRSEQHGRMAACSPSESGEQDGEQRGERASLRTASKRRATAGK